MVQKDYIIKRFKSMGYTVTDGINDDIVISIKTNSGFNVRMSLSNESLISTTYANIIVDRTVECINSYIIKEL